MKGPNDNDPLHVRARSAVPGRTGETKAETRARQFLAERGYGRAIPGFGQSGFGGGPAHAMYHPGTAGVSHHDRAAARQAAREIAVRYMDAAAQFQAPAPVAAYRTWGPPTPAWTSIGPTLIPDGQTYSADRADVSGRVTAIAVDPRDGNHILVGAAAGGIWETRDGGANWAPRTDFMATLTTGAIIFDPMFPTIAYAGTGEGWWMYAPFGTGILQSGDGGTTWRELWKEPFVGDGFFDLVIDPTNPRNLLAATTEGLYQATNNASWWQLRLNGPAWSVSMQVAGGPGVESLAACQSGLYGSTDGGANWFALALPNAPGQWASLAVEHARSNPRVAYAFGLGVGMAAPSLYRRDPFGGWSQIHIPASFDSKQAGYNWCMAVPWDRDDQVYVGAIDLWRGEAPWGDWNWTNLSSKTAGDSIHPDQQVVALHPTDPNVVFAGNDGGIYRSPDRGITWQSLNRGLAITEMEYIAHDPGNTRWLMGGTQDNGTVRFQGNAHWEQIADGDGGDCAVNQSNPNIVFHTYYNLSLERSFDRGQNWQGVVLDPHGQLGQSLFYPPVECCNDTIVIAGNIVYVSRDSGSTWTQVALPAEASLASALFLPSPDEILVGTSTGRIYRLTWTAQGWNWTWTLAGLTSPRLNAFISDIFVYQFQHNYIWATSTMVGGGRVFLTLDGGFSWMDRSSGLPDLPVNCVEVDPNNVNRIWLGTDQGVFQSLDGGASWSRFGTGLPNVIVGDLLLHQQGRLLRAATRSRGVWEIHVG